MVAGYINLDVPYISYNSIVFFKTLYCNLKNIFLIKFIIYYWIDKLTKMSIEFIGQLSYTEGSYLWISLANIVVIYNYI